MIRFTDIYAKIIERIIGQWIIESNGPCFGFEGPPGVGKNFAKNGMGSKCLKDAEGRKERPFYFKILVVLQIVKSCAN